VPAELAAECAKLDTEFVALRSQAAPLDQFYVPTRYPNSPPGGIPAEAFARADAERALTLGSRGDRGRQAALPLTSGGRR
jgi:HEPN domain-containing protein